MRALRTINSNFICIASASEVASTNPLTTFGYVIDYRTAGKSLRNIYHPRCAFVVLQQFLLYSAFGYKVDLAKAQLLGH